MLPSLAAMWELNFPPGLKSLVAEVVCQSSDALFHCMMCSGEVYMVQTFSTGAWTIASTVMLVLSDEFIVETI